MFLFAHTVSLWTLNEVYGR